MRPNVLAKTLVGATVVAAIATGGLAGAGNSYATTTPTSGSAASSNAVIRLTYDNLGLTIAEGKRVQNFLISRGYNPGQVDGELGEDSWKAMQHYLHDYGYGYPGPFDGVVGANTIKALQRRLADGFGYTGAIDGVAGSGTRAAFKRFADRV
ncbi:peptidoglycan-binding protein [Amycolatopsis sp. Hca4]|uniref:peptidoglycan-binding domain-containing protein n=1 Tax=Amycolatopsis sp. Hca4 TaxID=2742131 RepID=UPI001590F714|nr:peptidoglycan-binding protein [Amycolatopsis sp. Hca4]QKV74243.1 peptidoglycan-binding protein [Amycolatopsis sp. Hca4]